MKYLARTVLFTLAVHAANAATIIHPVEGIADLWRLPEEEFREKYAGINITGLGVGDEGWYVRYRHENLTYLFGPLGDEESARKAMWDLEAVRDAAIRERPTLSTSQVDLVKFNYSGVYGARGNQPYRGGEEGDAAGGAGTDADGKPMGGNGDMDGDGIPDNRDGDMDGDGIPNEQDGDMDGDGTPNESDGDMDGDGIANNQDGDRDGDGMANTQDARMAQYDVTQQNQQGRGGQPGTGQPQEGQQQFPQQVADLRNPGETDAMRLPSPSQSQSSSQSRSSQQSSSSSSSQSQSSSSSGQPSQPGQPSQQQQQQSSFNIMQLLKAILGIR